MPKFSDRLKLLRRESGLSQYDFSKQLGISKSSVNMYERGEREPSLETLEAIADYFNVDMDFLLGKSEHRNKNQWLSTIEQTDDLERLIEVYSCGSIARAKDSCFTENETKNILGFIQEQGVRTKAFIDALSRAKYSGGGSSGLSKLHKTDEVDRCIESMTAWAKYAMNYILQDYTKSESEELMEEMQRVFSSLSHRDQIAWLTRIEDAIGGQETEEV